MLSGGNLHQEGIFKSLSAAREGRGDGLASHTGPPGALYPVHQHLFAFSSLLNHTTCCCFVCCLWAVLLPTTFLASYGWGVDGSGLMSARWQLIMCWVSLFRCWQIHFSCASCGQSLTVIYIVNLHICYKKWFLQCQFQKIYEVYFD